MLDAGAGHAREKMFAGVARSMKADFNHSSTKE